MQQFSYVDTYIRATSRIHYRVLHLYHVSACKSVAVLFQTLEKMLQNLYSGSLPNKMTPTTPKRIEISDPH